MGTHLTAVDEAVSAGGLGPVDRPLIELVRLLARQMDAAGEDAGTRLVASYLTSVRTLTNRAAAGRELQQRAVAKRETEVEPAAIPEEEEVPGGDVLDFRSRARGRRQAS